MSHNHVVSILEWTISKTNTHLSIVPFYILFSPELHHDNIRQVYPVSYPQTGTYACVLSCHLHRKLNRNSILTMNSRNSQYLK